MVEKKGEARRQVFVVVSETVVSEEVSTSVAHFFLELLRCAVVVAISRVGLQQLLSKSLPLVPLQKR